MNPSAGSKAQAVNGFGIPCDAGHDLDIADLGQLPEPRDQVGVGDHHPGIGVLEHVRQHAAAVGRVRWYEESPEVVHEQTRSEHVRSRWATSRHMRDLGHAEPSSSPAAVRFVSALRRSAWSLPALSSKTTQVPPAPPRMPRADSARRDRRARGDEHRGVMPAPCAGTAWPAARKERRRRRWVSM